MPAPALLLAAAVAAPTATVSSGALRQLRGALNATGPPRRASLRISDCTPPGSPVTNIRWTAPASLNLGQVTDIRLTGDNTASASAPTCTTTLDIGLLVISAAMGLTVGCLFANSIKAFDDDGSETVCTSLLSGPISPGPVACIVCMSLLSGPVSPGPAAVDAEFTTALIPPGTVANLDTTLDIGLLVISAATGLTVGCLFANSIKAFDDDGGETVCTKGGGAELSRG